MASSTWSGDAQGDVLTSIEGFNLSVGNDIFWGDANDNVVNGGIGNDQISGSAGDDTLDGNDGNDVLTGGLGGDILFGHLGVDMFRYTAVEESQAITINGTSQLDQIADFTQTVDRIDLRLIDANPTLAGDQAFVFIRDPPLPLRLDRRRVADHRGRWHRHDQCLDQRRRCPRDANLHVASYQSRRRTSGFSASCVHARESIGCEYAQG